MANIQAKVTVDVSQATKSLKTLQDELNKLGTFKGNKTPSFVNTLKSSLNSIKTAVNQLKTSMESCFKNIGSSANTTSIDIKKVAQEVNELSNQSQKLKSNSPFKDINTQIKQAVTSANILKGKVNEVLSTKGNISSSSSKEVDKFGVQIKQTIENIKKLNSQEIRFAKTPFGNTDKFYTINRELIKITENTDKAKQGTLLLETAFRNLGQGKAFNMINYSIQQIVSRLDYVNMIIDTVKGSMYSLNDLGLNTKALGDWGKVNKEMLKSTKTTEQFRNKLLSLEESDFNNVVHSFNLMDVAIREGLLPDLAKANSELTVFKEKAGMIKTLGGMSPKSFNSLNQVPVKIREIVNSFHQGALSTEKYTNEMKLALGSLNNVQFTKLTNSMNRLKQVQEQVKVLYDLTNVGSPKTLPLTGDITNMSPKINSLVKQLQEGKLSTEELTRQLMALNNTQFKSVTTNLENMNAQIKEGELNTKLFKENLSAMAVTTTQMSKQIDRNLKAETTGLTSGLTTSLEKFRENLISIQGLAREMKGISIILGGDDTLNATLRTTVTLLKESEMNAELFREKLAGLNTSTLSNLENGLKRINMEIKEQQANLKLFQSNLAGINVSAFNNIKTGVKHAYDNKGNALYTPVDIKSMQQANTELTKTSTQLGRTKKQVNALDKASAMLRRTVSGLVVIFGWNLVMDLIEVGKNSMDASFQIKKMGESMKWSNSQISSFTGQMRKMQGLYPKIDMSQTAKSVMEMAKNYKLTNEQATKLIKTSAVFTSAMAREGRTTEDANLALKDYLDGGSGWTRRMSEIGATREKLKATGKWNGNENDINGKIEALDVLMAQKGYNELAKNIYTLDDAFNAFKYTLGSVIGELGEGLTPTIIAFTKIVLSTIQSVRSGISWIKGNGWANEIGQLLAVAGAVSLITLGVLKLVGAIKGILMAKTLITTMASPLGIILITVSAITVAIYGIGRALGWWHDFNSMIEAISNNLMTMQGQVTAIIGLVSVVGSIFLAKKYLDESNIIVRCIDKVIGAIKSYIGALAAKKAAEEASVATTAGTKGAEAAATAGAAGAEAAAASKVAKDGKEVSRFSRMLGALGIEYSADAGFVTMFQMSASALSSMLGVAVPVIAALTAVVGLVIAAVAGLAAEAILLVKGLQILIASMNFDGIDLSGAVKGIKQVGTAMSELGKAVYGMLSISAMMTLIGYLDVITLGFGSVAAACNKLKSSISQINSFADAPPIRKEAITRLTQVAHAMDSLAKATQSMGSMNSDVHWAIFWQWINGGILENLQKAHNKLASAVPIINSFSDLDDINPATSKKIKSVCDSLADVSKGTSALGNLSSDVHWDIFWQWINGGILENLSKARSKLEDASRILNQFDLAEIPKGTGEKLKRVSYALLDVNEALNNLDKLPNVTNDADTIAKVSTYSTTMANIRGVLENVSKELRILSFTYAIPEGTGEKINRITWTLRDVETAFKTLQNVLNNLNFDGDYQSAINSMKNVGRVLRGVSLELNALSTVAVMPTDVGVKLQRITWVLNDVKNAGTTLNNVLLTLNNFTLDVNSTTSSIQNIGRVIRSVSIELNTLSTIAVMPEGLGEKLQRMTWTLNSLKSTVTALNNAYYGNLVNIPPAEGFHGKLIALRQILYQISGFANAVSTYGTSNANGNGIAEMVKNVTTQVNACVTAVNNAVSRLKNAGKNLGSALKTGVASGVSNTAHAVWVQINSINSALSSVQGKVKQTTSVFSTFQSRVYTLTQGVNNLKNAINNIPSSKTVTITINASTNTKGAGFGGLFAGWSVSSALGSDWDTISNYHGGTASTNSLYGGLKGKVHGRLHGLFAGLNTGVLVDNPKTLNPLQAFSAVATGIMNGSSYDHYYNSKNNGDVNDTLASGSFNCYDGSLLLMSLASLFGLKSELKGTMVNGEGHAYTRVGGKVFDSTAMQLYHRRSSPKVNYAGNGSKSKSDTGKESKPITVTVNVNGDVYGERDFKDKIRSGAEEVLIDLFNNSRGTGV